MVAYYYGIRLHDDEVQIKRQTGLEELNISFRRTVRVPDNSATSMLPPDLGRFPLYSVHKYASNLPADTVAKGGIFMPMYQREAMWIHFKSNTLFAIKIYVGSVNAVSGEPALETYGTTLRRREAHFHYKSVQDYVIVPDQLWLDGIASNEGVVKQFVATRLGEGYTVEAQITGEEARGGLQFEITPAVVEASIERSFFVKTPSGKYMPTKVAWKTTVADLKAKIEMCEGIPIHSQRLLVAGQQLGDNMPIPLNSDNALLVLRLKGGGGPTSAEESAKHEQAMKDEMGIAAGGMIKQTIVRDFWPVKIWHKKATIAFNVHLLNTKVFEKVTGIAAPNTPVTIKQYQELDLPFYELYEEPSTIHGAFGNVKSIGEIDGVEERDYVISTKVINPKEFNKENTEVKTARDPEDISNPAGPFSEFRAVCEIEEDLGEVWINSSS